jgi:hypothetical protein
VKLVPFSEKERTNVCSQTTDVILDVGALSRLFSATILVLVPFEGFTLRRVIRFVLARLWY